MADNATATRGGGVVAAPSDTPTQAGGRLRVPSLVTLCTRTISRDPGLLADAPYVPEDICTKVLACLREENGITDAALDCVRRHNPLNPEHERCRLRSIDLSGSPTLTCNGVAKVASHPLIALKLDRCPEISGDIFKVLRTGCCRTLQALSLSHCGSIQPQDFKELVWFDQLRSVNLSNTAIVSGGLSVLNHNVVELDLSHTNVGVDAFGALRHLNLQSLSLAGTAVGQTALPSLLQMRKLQRLDISECRQLQTQDLGAEDADAAALEENLQDFFASLTNIATLKWLNLSGCGVTTDTVKTILSEGHALEFLGIVSTRASAMATVDAPDTVAVASLNTKAEILNALSEFHATGSYDVVLSCLRAVFRLVSPTYTPSDEARITSDNGLTRVMINCMHRFVDKLDLQVVSSAVLFYTTLDTTKEQLPLDRREALHAVLRTMDQHLGCLQLVKNCCLTLRNFQTENELALFSRQVAILLLRAALLYSDRTIQLTSVFLCCHNLASLHPWHKAAIGEAGGIQLAVQLIHEKKCPEENEETDTAVLEACWTFLWNITDETPSNAERFLSEGGLDLVVEVLQLYPDGAILRRNVMGLVTNIAEVKRLRPSLMTEDMLSELDKCLTGLDDLEVSYNVTGTLCHLMAEGEAFWDRHEVAREQRSHLLGQITTAVDGWSLSAERWINYRCLRPVISLLSLQLPWEIRYWAAWALASLCTANPDKYCEMCLEENALEPLRLLEGHHETVAHPPMTHVLQLTLSRCNQWQSERQEAEPHDTEV
eukprot:m.23578 g.23578  ORF g.23578 m.23578 type:complete len:772 (-) comp7230_c0_seq1:181-2496(-)